MSEFRPNPKFETRVVVRREAAGDGAGNAAIRGRVARGRKNRTWNASLQIFLHIPSTIAVGILVRDKNRMI